MRTGNKKINLCIILLAVGLVIVLSDQGYCRQRESESYALMIQQSPVSGGTVTPGLGVQRFGLNEVVTLTAIPKPGYHFVYWLGDVIEETTEETTVVVDSPKIIIAVFERTEYSTLTELDTIMPGIGRGGAMAVRTDFRMGRPINPGGWKDRDWPTYEPPESYDRDFPVPDGDMGEDFPVPLSNDFPVPMSNDFPVPDDEPIPEPATMLLFGVGAVFAISKRKSRSMSRNN
jgi:hypothetical protein